MLHIIKQNLRFHGIYLIITLHLNIITSKNVLCKNIIIIIFFYKPRWGNANARCVGLAPTKTPVFSNNKVKSKKSKWVERKVSLFHTPSRGPHQFSPPFKQRKIMVTWKKRRLPPGSRKSKLRKKTGEKLKENKTIKLN